MSATEICCRWLRCRRTHPRPSRWWLAVCLSTERVGRHVPTSCPGQAILLWLAAAVIARPRPVNASDAESKVSPTRMWMRHAISHVHTAYTIVHAPASSCARSNPQKKSIWDHSRCADMQRAGLASLDTVFREDEVRKRVHTFQSVPAKLRGTVHAALRAGLRAPPQHQLRGN